MFTLIHPLADAAIATLGCLACILGAYELGRWQARVAVRSGAKKFEPAPTPAMPRTEWPIDGRGSVYRSLEALVRHELARIESHQGLLLLEMGGGMRILTGLDSGIESAVPSSLRAVHWVRWRRFEHTGFVEAWDLSEAERDRVIEELERRQDARDTRIGPQSFASVLA